MCITKVAAKKGTITNPEGYNQYMINPKQDLFLSYYLDPKSETWSNAYQSALRAGYSDEYAKNMTGQMPDWLSENIKDTSLLQTALNNLNEFLNNTDERVQNIRWDATKTVLKGLAKNKFSERTELTGKDGKELKISFDSSFENK